MEFLRFGSRIPGKYWGCCAVDIIQDFKFNPDAKMSSQIVYGDDGMPATHEYSGELLYAGPTYRDIFKTRIRMGTFSTEDMPNHAFFAVLTAEQCSDGWGKEWLKILKEEGFEFIRCVDNSVYTGPDINDSMPPHKNYIFGLFRNIGAGKVSDPHKPPKAWLDMPDPKNGMSDDDYQRLLWEAGETKFVTQKELLEAGAPIMKSGICTTQPKNITNEVKKEQAEPKKASSAPWAEPKTVPACEIFKVAG